MKKIIGFLLLFTMIFTICGCKNNDIKNDKENVSSGTSNKTDLSSKEFSLGRVNGNVYESDFIGLGYKLDENWSFYDEEQIKELNSAAIDMAGDEFEELVKNSTIVYDMYATDSDQLDNININLEKVSNSKLLSLNIVENMKTLIPDIKDAFRNMGYENINCEIIDVEVDGRMLDALHTTSEINGVNIYQTIFQKKCNGYLASIAITTCFNDTIADLIDNFYWTE